MKAILIHLLKSFWLAKGKFVLCVLASILSAWGISTVVYGYLLTTRDFEENFAASHPVDIILTVKKPSVRLWELVKGDADVKSAERRETLAARIRSVTGAWTSLNLFGVEDINHSTVSKFDVTQRIDSAAIPGLFIERNGKSFLDFSSGQLMIQVPGDSVRTLPYGGLIFDAGQAPSQMEQTVYGYIRLDYLKQFLPQQQERVLIEVNNAHATQEELDQTAARLRKLVAQEGGEVVSLVIPTPGEHIHQGIVNGISFLQRSFGSILAILGVILLSLILVTWLYPQYRQVGITKAIGASSSVVLISYFTVLALIVVIGLLIGVPLGYRTALIYDRTIAFIQNFNPVKGPLPLLNHLYVITPCLLLPLFFAASPLIKVSTSTVQRALNSIFYTSHRKSFVATQQLPTNSIFKYSINNLFRDSRRTFLLFLLMSIGIGLFATGFNLRHSIKTDLQGYIDSWGYDINIILEKNSSETFPHLETLPCVESVAYISVDVVSFSLPEKPTPHNSILQKLPPNYDRNSITLLSGEVKEGCYNCVYVSQRSADDFEGIPLGKEFELTSNNGTRNSYVFSGIIKSVSSFGFYVFAEKPNETFREVRIKVKDGIKIAKARQMIDDSLLDNDSDFKALVDMETWVASFEGHQKPTYVIIQAMGVFTVVLALAGMVIILNLSLQERAREVGVMKALGSSIGGIVSLLHREYTLINSISLVVGFALGFVLTKVICHVLGSLSLSIPIVTRMDGWFIVGTSVSLFFVQWIVITTYGRYKVRQTSNSLLTQIQ